MAPALFLMGIGPLAALEGSQHAGHLYAHEVGARRGARHRPAVAADAGRFQTLAALGFFLAAWIALAVLAALLDRLKYSQGKLPQKLASLPRGFWGMLLAHFGMAVGIAGIAVVANYSTERDVRMEVGSYAELAGYTFTFRGTAGHDGPNYRAARGTLEVSKDGKLVATPASGKARLQRLRDGDDRGRRASEHLPRHLRRHGRTAR